MFKATKRGWRRVALGMLLLPGLGGLVHGQTPVSPAATAANSKSSATPGDAARKLMRDARIAFNQGDYAKARKFAEMAKADKSPPQFWTESPDSLIAEIDRKQGKKPTRKNTPSGDPRTLVKMGRTALESGQLNEAQDLARQAESLSRGLRYGLFEDSPLSLLSDVQKARARHDRDERELSAHR